MNVYLTTTERKFVSRAAEELGTTDAYIIRLVLRKVMGLPIGGRGESEYAHLTKIGCGHVQNLTGMG